MNFERIAWWIFWLSFAFVLVLAIYGLSISILLATPAELSYIIGLIAFLLLGNRLIFGYGWLTNFLEVIITQKQVTAQDIQKIKDKMERNTYDFTQMLKDLSLKFIVSLFLKDLDYYRYAYYVGFVLVTVLTIMSKFNLLGDLIVGRYVEGVFWGAATATLFVWGLEQLAKASFAELLALDVKFEEKTQEVKENE